MAPRGQDRWPTQRKGSILSLPAGGWLTIMPRFSEANVPALPLQGHCFLQKVSALPTLIDCDFQHHPLPPPRMDPEAAWLSQP